MGGPVGTVPDNWITNVETRSYELEKSIG